MKQFFFKKMTARHLKQVRANPQAGKRPFIRTLAPEDVGPLELWHDSTGRMEGLESHFALFGWWESGRAVQTCSSSLPLGHYATSTHLVGMRGQLRLVLGHCCVLAGCLLYTPNSAQSRVSQSRVSTGVLEVEVDVFVRSERLVSYQVDIGSLT